MMCSSGNQRRCPADRKGRSLSRKPRRELSALGAGMTGSGGAETSGIEGSGAERVLWKAAVAMPRRAVPARSVAASGLKLLDAGA